MSNFEQEGFSIYDLKIQKIGLEDRIKRLEQAGELGRLIFLNRLIEVERSNLQKVYFELEKKKRDVAVK